MCQSQELQITRFLPTVFSMFLVCFFVLSVASWDQLTPEQGTHRRNPAVGRSPVFDLSVPEGGGWPTKYIRISRLFDGVDT